MHCTDTTSRPRAIQLHRAAFVQPGYLSRTRVRSSRTGTHHLLQAKDLSRDSGIAWSDVASFRPERNAELYQISCGDILLVARGRSHWAYLVTENLANTLASNVFYIIRPDATIVRPAYLAWWLNLPETQAQINACSCGTGIGYINRQALGNLMVVLPPAEVQSTIEAVVSLKQRQVALQARLNHKRDQLVQLVCRHAVYRGQE
jgi:hypothetical protein